MFGTGGYWGGGERYPLELARAQAATVPTRLVVFGERPRRLRFGPLSIHVLPNRRPRELFNPFSELLAPEIMGAAVVHLHQIRTGLTDLAAIVARLSGRLVYATDHGAAAGTLLSQHAQSRLLHGHLAVSKFAATFHPHLLRRTTVVYGGFDPSRFAPGDLTRERLVVYVGRVMPHKGIDVLIQALPPSARLEVYGRPYDRRYAADLVAMATGKNVRFITSAGDAEIVRAYQRARVSVLPSVHRTMYGELAPKTELFGLALVEAMACGTPVICSRAGAMPEVVVDGQTGYVVEPADASAMRDRLERLLTGDARWHGMSSAAAAHARAQFTWTRVAARTLDAYKRLSNTSDQIVPTLVDNLGRSVARPLSSVTSL